MNFKIILIFSIFTFYWGNIFSQYTFDQCQYAKNITIDGGYCSNSAEFSNIGATPDPEFPNGCVSLKFANGVWFSFIPKKSAVSIRVFGNGEGGTMESPKILLFDDCNNYISCTSGGIAKAELIAEKLIIGKTYYIMIESAIGGEGTFQICIDDFTPVPSPQSDCDKGVILCDKSPFIVESLTSAGENLDEIESTNCMYNNQNPQNSERGSSWYKWTCEDPGTLTFILTPNDYINNNQVTVDLDFAVYELPNGINNCENKIKLRCMASGANTDALGNQLPLDQWFFCNGKTGLSELENDINEEPGCRNNSSNFLAPINMESGKSYVLIVNNYHNNGIGFSIEFGGTGTFLGPEADFNIDALQEFECDKTIRFTDNSESKTDSIISYSWSFGDGATPISANSKGYHDVIYDSFGEKIVALTIESSRGCLVTKLLPIYVEPCCADFSLDIDAEITNPICHDENNGTILGKGIEGSPPYQFSLDGKDFQTIPIFYDLGDGIYELFIQDKKGCRDSIVLDIIDPETLIADAGPDITIELSDITSMNGSYYPSEYDVTQLWTPNYNLDDSTDFETKAWPYKTTTYTLTVTQDSTGCIAYDEMTIFVNKERLIRIPNVFTPNGDGLNDYFTAYNIKAALEIDKVLIFNRWGELIYKENNIPLGDLSKGWDGTFKGIRVNPGVYVYLFEIRFLDNEIIPFSGDITVLR